VKARIVEDDVGREALRARFLFSQQFMQDDPWAERAAGQHAELHQHIAQVRPLETV
jgi:nitrite reductase (NADH) large subunit